MLFIFGGLIVLLYFMAKAMDKRGAFKEQKKLLKKMLKK